MESKASYAAVAELVELGHTATRPAGAQSRRSTTFIRLFKYLALCSAALTLTSILPTPWSTLHSKIVEIPLEAASTDPASEWQDNIWPLREQTSWDISTDFPFPRKLEYDVTEGTWLHLDVHPKSGDIVFDMLGDLYCLPGSEATTTGLTKARPVLLGIPYDSDPHFSPEGDRLVFRSDAELGVENIWVMAWKGCEAMDVRSAQNLDLKEALEARALEEDLLATGIKENHQRQYNRLLREGRLDARRVTNETYRWVTDARFHPSGERVIATKWYTSSRSLGAGEGWEFDVPSLSDLQPEQVNIVPGAGKRITSRTLPPGWSSDDYGDQQIGPEQHIWTQDGDAIIYSTNVVDESAFSYSKDVHKGIYSIFQKNLTTGNVETLVDAFPGGASRPELSRDGRTLAFVRRVRDKEALVFKDLSTGTIHHIWHGLTYDLSTISAPMGTYPSFAFTPSDDAVIIWSSGQIYRVPLSTNTLGERIAHPTSSPAPIPFTAHIELSLAETRTDDFSADMFEMETGESQRVRAFKEMRVDEKGERVVFQAAGVTYVQHVAGSLPTKVPVLDSSAAYYSPSFVPGAEHLVIHARWSDTQFTTFEIADLESGVAYKVAGLPFGRYFSPVLCKCTGSTRTIAFVKSAGDILTGDILATAGAGLYLAELTLPEQPDSQHNKAQVELRNLRFIPSDIDSDDRVNMRFVHINQKLLVQQSSSAFVIDFSEGPDKFGKYKHVSLGTGKMSSELAVAPGTGAVKGGKWSAESLAFVDFFHVYVVASGVDVEEGEELWSRPGNATKGLARVSLDGGHDVTFSGDGKKVVWFLGPYLHSLELSSLQKCTREIEKDTLNFGIACVTKHVSYHEVIVEHSTDIARLKRESEGRDQVVIYNATVLTMETGEERWDVIKGGIVIVRGGVITSVGHLAKEELELDEQGVPRGPATAINAQGGFVVPGFIDVHAHWDGFSARYPAKSWEMETFLAYGVTTLHKWVSASFCLTGIANIVVSPSADNVEGFVERSRVESGQLIGPRIYTVGDVIYGAGEARLHQDIADDAEAYSALVRIKAEGGPASISYKNYNLPSRVNRKLTRKICNRASRQRLLLAARDLKMLCMPEGGMNYDWDLTYIIDGMTTVEHALPVPGLYSDVLTLFALSGTGSTPTHIVNYGGAWGEQLVWATEDIPNDPKLRRFTRHDRLQALTESTARPANSYQLFNTSSSVAKMVDLGLQAHIGAHGEPPLGLNYHAEMWFTKQGGLSNYEVIRAATSSAAKTLGLSGSIGTLSRNKLADLLIYPPGVDILQGDISSTREIQFVMRGGRLWDASTMEEVWPTKGRKQILPQFNAD
ncbi:hypothetical protein H0H92_011559 [Tricholoma furcatifolium]|nr:hypothetical protein H0H92_011559 [Tricholoma furcatifolium]